MQDRETAPRKPNSTRNRIQRLFRGGPAETVRKTGRYVSRKAAERRFSGNMTPSPEELTRQRAEVFSRPLLFSVTVPLYNTPRDLLEEMVDSVCEQSYTQWELCLADGSDAEHGDVEAYCRMRAAEDSRIVYRKLERNGGISENTNACLDMASGDYVALFDHDDVLLPNALYEMRAAVEKTGADFLYSDELIFQSPRRDRVIGIRFKPSFSPDSLLTNNYICHLTVFSRELLERTGRFRREYDGSQDHDLVLRLTNRAKRIAHVSKVLYLWRAVPSSVASDIYSKPYAIEAGRSAVEHFLRTENGIEAKVESTDVFPTMYRVRYPIEGNPRVRVILDARREMSLPKERLDALRDSAGWPNCAWTVLRGGQNGADSCVQLTSRLGESRSALWARAAEQSEEEYLLFVDGVPESVAEGWVREMLEFALQPHVGAVGPKIHFSNGRVRHAGVVIGMGRGGAAGRPYFRTDGDSAGYFGQMAVAEDVSAVTDCLMVSREKYTAAGGFDPEYGDALFDVDFCLRLLEKGYYNVYTPHAPLKMGRRGSARFDAGREYASWKRDAEIFRKRNAGILTRGDPYYNPNLSLRYENWQIGAAGEKRGNSAK